MNTTETIITASLLYFGMIPAAIMLGTLFVVLRREKNACNAV